MRASTVSRAASAAWDAVIVGGGHNGLVTAAYLARAGKRVLLCERRHTLGGAAVTEELFPGFHYSRASYVYSLFRPHIVSDLKLHERGLTLLARKPSSFTPVVGSTGPSLLLGGGAAEDAASIAQFSTRDARQYAAYNAMLDKYAAAFVPLLDRRPPALEAVLSSTHSLSERMEAIMDLLRAGRVISSLGTDLPGFMELLTAPATKILDRWFESDILKTTLATDAVIGALVSPSTAQSAYVLLHHVMCGTWFNVRGGMGALSQAVAAAARSHGAELRTGAEVKQLLCEDAGGASKGRVVGVEMMDGTIARAPTVIVNAAPQVAFNRLLPDAVARAYVPEGMRQQLRSINVATGSAKINVALDRLPNFTCAPNTGSAGAATVMPHHHGTIHFETRMAQLEAAFADAAAGRPSQRPIIEMTIPSALDNSISPPGRHVALLFVQYAPYAPVDGPWTPASKDAFADRVFDVIEEHAPGFKASVLHRDILVPPDLESIFGLPGGNIFHGSMGLDQLFWLRPTAGMSQYRTPIGGLYLASAGTHPGGGVMGAAGHNAAMQVLRDAGMGEHQLRQISSCPQL